MTQPNVLVLMAAFNGSKWILEQAQTILNQVDVNVHLVISDDGSTDDTRAAIDRLTADPRVRAVSTATPTGSAAQNFLSLIRSTSAEQYDFVSLADQDDIWLNDKLYRACTTLKQTGARGYSSAVVAFWSDTRESILIPESETTATDFLFESAGQGCTYVLDQPFYQRLRAFFILNGSATAYIHYHDWVIYALSRTWKLQWIFDRRPGLKYRQHQLNDTGARTSLDGIWRRLKQIRGGWYTRQMEMISKICLQASPNDPTIFRWHQLLIQPRRLSRRWSMTIFVLKGGRRRIVDRIIFLGAVIAGWI